MTVKGRCRERYQFVAAYRVNSARQRVRRPIHFTVLAQYAFATRAAPGSRCIRQRYDAQWRGQTSPWPGGAGRWVVISEAFLLPSSYTLPLFSRNIDSFAQKPVKKQAALRRHESTRTFVSALLAIALAGYVQAEGCSGPCSVGSSCRHLLVNCRRDASEERSRTDNLPWTTGM